MKIHRLFPLLLAAASTGFAVAQDDEPAVGFTPVSPLELWKVMPGRLDTWELLVSTGETRFGEWLESRVVREYRKLPDASGGEPAKPAGAEPTPPARTRIVITDTGGFEGAVAHFQDFVPGESDGIERKTLAGHPAFVIPWGEKELGVELLVEGRFRVEITLENQPPRFIQEWLRRLDLRALAGIPAGEKIPLPEEIRILQIDQLEPRKNRAYLLATTSDARLATEFEEDEASLRALIGEVPPVSEPDPGAGPEPGEGTGDPVEPSGDGAPKVPETP